MGQRERAICRPLVQVFLGGVLHVPWPCRTKPETSCIRMTLRPAKPPSQGLKNLLISFFHREKTVLKYVNHSLLSVFHISIFTYWIFLHRERLSFPGKMFIIIMGSY